MTSVTINKKTKSIEISGHTKEPVVCHGISALINSVAFYLENEMQARITMDDDAYAKIEKPEVVDIVHRYLYDTFLDYLERTLVLIEEEYPGNIIFEYIE